MASPFASHVTEIVALPFDPPHTATIQKLSGKDLDAAQYAHMVGVATGRGRNWATRFLSLAGAGVATEADAVKVLSDPLSGFDRLALVKSGVKAWSYDAVPVTAEAVEDLDDEALEFLASSVLKLTKPALFQSAEDREASKKND